MSYGTNNKEKEIGMDLNSPIIWEVGIVFTIILVVMTVYLYGLYLRVENAENARKLYTPRLAEVANTKLEQQYKISSYRWVDHDQGLVSIPIDLAMNKAATVLTNQRFEATRIGDITLGSLEETALADGGLGGSETPPGE